MSLPLKRLRLELDRTIRTRSFFGRALRGALEEDEYVDLVAQFGALLHLAGGAAARDLTELTVQDLAALQPRGHHTVNTVTSICLW